MAHQKIEKLLFCTAYMDSKWLGDALKSHLLVTFIKLFCFMLENLT